MNAKSGGWAHHNPDGEFFKYGSAGFEWLEGGAGQAQELAAWASGRSDDHRGNGENGYKALEMIHAAYESARLHVQVQMPMKTVVNPLDLMIADGHRPFVIQENATFALAASAEKTSDPTAIIPRSVAIHSSTINLKAQMHNLRIEALAFECNLQEFHLLIGFEDSDRCTALQLATVTPKSAK